MNRKFIVISIIILIILCIAFCKMSLSDSNDTFYLIKLGETISKNGIDMIDHFSWIPNLPYTYPHWLYSIFIFFIYNNFGFTGVYISNIMSFIVLVLLIYYISLKLNKSKMIALITSFVSIVPLSLFIAPRAQSISIIFILLEVYFINQLIGTGKKKYIVFLSICSLIIANVHATVWIVFFVFFFPFFGEQLFYLYGRKKNKIITFNNRISCNKINNIKLLLIAFGICFLIGLLSPSKICYTYFFKIALGDSQQYISEHFPIVIIKYPLVIILCFLLFFSKSKIKLSEFFMICGITLMTFMSQRHIIFFCTIALIYFSIVLKRNIDEKKDKTFEILEKKIFSHWCVVFTLIIALSVFCYLRLNENIKKGFVDEKVYPVNAVKFIKDNLDYKNIKIINDYNFGSYLLFNDIKVFNDSRCDLYFEEFNGNDMNIIDDYYEFFSINKNYDYNSLLDKYGGEYFLIEKSNIINYLLKYDNQYREVYGDEYFILYQRIFYEE